MERCCTNCTAAVACYLPSTGRGWCRDCGKCGVCGERIAFRVVWAHRGGGALYGERCADHAAPLDCPCSTGVLSLEPYAWSGE